MLMQSEAPSVCEINKKDPSKKYKTFKMVSKKRDLKEIDTQEEQILHFVT